MYVGEEIKLCVIVQSIRETPFGSSHVSTIFKQTEREEREREREERKRAKG